MNVKKLGLFLLMLSWGVPSLASETSRPNIILCMADDLGWGDTGYNGHPVIQTPNLDEMARAGLRFDRFYAAAPVCSPTRGSALTGRHPYRYGIRTANHGHLKREEICLAEVLKSLGYRTGHFGKWHLGTMTPDFSGKGKGRQPSVNYMTPGMAGFDEWFSTEYAVATWNPYAPENAHGRNDVRALYWHNGRNLTNVHEEQLTGCDSRIIMDRALPFIGEAARDGQPFFAVVWFHAPHAPVVGGPDYRTRYATHPENEQHYYAVVTALDEQVGRLRRELRSLGVAEDTLLWFCSDNGPEGNPGKRQRFQGSAGPYRGRKRSLYEGGVRVPGLLEWPHKIKGPRVTDFPAVTSDYFPTVLEIVGFEIPSDRDRPFDGVSLVPLIRGERTPRARPIGFQSQGVATLTGDRYKLVHNPAKKRLRSDNGDTPVSEWELYDLIADPSETRNLASARPQVVLSMRRTLESWTASCQASAAGDDYPPR
jgi:arylsulfatase A-like enzyme